MQVLQYYSGTSTTAGLTLDSTSIKPVADSVRNIWYMHGPYVSLCGTGLTQTTPHGLHYDKQLNIRIWRVLSALDEHIKFYKERQK